MPTLQDLPLASVSRLFRIADGMHISDKHLDMLTTEYLLLKELTEGKEKNMHLLKKVAQLEEVRGRLEGDIAEMRVSEHWGGGEEIGSDM